MADNDTIVERLRKQAELAGPGYPSDEMTATLEWKAADALEALTAKLARAEHDLGELRATFRANMLRHVPGATHEDIDRAMNAVAPATERAEIENFARAALADGEGAKL